jgi:hypothetical protein
VARYGVPALAMQTRALRRHCQAPGHIALVELDTPVSADGTLVILPAMTEVLELHAKPGRCLHPCRE